MQRLIARTAALGAAAQNSLILPFGFLVFAAVFEAGYI